MSNIESLMDELMEMDEIINCGLISIDGRPIIMRLADDVDSDVFSIMSATIYGAATTISYQYSKNDPNAVNIVNGKDETLIYRCSKKTLVTVVKKKGFNDPLFLDKLEKLRNEFN